MLCARVCMYVCVCVCVCQFAHPAAKLIVVCGGPPIAEYSSLAIVLVCVPDARRRSECTVIWRRSAERRRYIHSGGEKHTEREKI